MSASPRCPLLPVMSNFISSRQIPVVSCHWRGLDGPRVLGPAEIVTAERQIAIAFAGDLEYGITNCGLDRSGAVVAHPEQPVSGLEETNVDLRRLFINAG